jgi:hypothetical protein
MLNNEEAKRKMKELERLFELKKQALVEGIQKHEQKTQERKKSIVKTQEKKKSLSGTTISSEDTPDVPSRRKSKSRLKQRVWVCLFLVLANILCMPYVMTILVLLTASCLLDTHSVAERG